MARGQSKPSTQGLSDKVILATIGMIFNVGEQTGQMLVAGPDTVRRGHCLIVQQSCCFEYVGPRDPPREW
eukprot:scaffold103001_cov58-Attheya_sp.AAC.3